MKYSERKGLKYDLFVGCRRAREVRGRIEDILSLQPLWEYLHIITKNEEEEDAMIFILFYNLPHTHDVGRPLA